MINIVVKDLDGKIHEVQVNEGENLMAALREHEWGVPAICGGLCSCGTCHVYIDTKWLDKFQQADSDEQDLIDEFDSASDNSRLSCQMNVREIHDGLSLTIAPDG